MNTINPDWQHWRTDVSAHFTGLLDTALVAREEAAPKRQYLGGSWVGHECPRNVALKWLSERETIRDGRVLRIFDSGHDGESRAARWLKLMGFDLREVDDQGKQFAFSDHGGRFRGSADGVIVGLKPITWEGLSNHEIIKRHQEGLEKYRFPMKWEHKTANTSKFREFQKWGVWGASLTYYGQSQIYSKKIKPVIDGVELDLTTNPTIFTVECKETSELYAELLHYDRTVADDIDDRAAKLLSMTPEDGVLSGPQRDAILAEFPKCSDKRTYATCAVCPFVNRCHGPSLLLPITRAHEVQ